MKRSHEDIECELLIETIRRIYGYDFSQYQRTSLNRRFARFRILNEFERISDIIPWIIKDRVSFQELLVQISVTVTEMFRDPFIYKSIIENVLPHLRTFPFLNVWNAGCATGEEAYSMAILLKENKLLKRTQIYATDLNIRSIQLARKAIFPIEKMKKFSLNYIEAGGKYSLSDYYIAQYRGAKMDSSLQQAITFAKHNLVMDGPFAEMHLIICKNVLIYFNKTLQEKVLRLMTDSLCYNGFLCLGDKESLKYTSVESEFKVIDEKAKIYQKKNFRSSILRNN